VLTAIAAVLYIGLVQLFQGGWFGPPLWTSESWADSRLWSYGFLAIILVAGLLQARSLPAEGVAVRAPATGTMPGQVDDPPFWRLLTGNVYWGLFWLPIRFFVGHEWFAAGTHKVVDPAWTQSGEALAGFLQGAVAMPEPPARPRITYDWYRDFLQFLLDREAATWFAPLVAWGEVLVGLGLLLGALVGIAAFFGTLMNFNFLLAGTASSNPVLFGLGVLLVLAWKVAGFWGLDRWLLPVLGTPWRAGTLFAPDPAGHATAAHDPAPPPARPLSPRG
jgi:thiosulfate dehydrogenase [quinone] large subunit